MVPAVKFVFSDVSTCSRSSGSGDGLALDRKDRGLETLGIIDTSSIVKLAVLRDVEALEEEYE